MASHNGANEMNRAKAKEIFDLAMVQALACDDAARKDSAMFCLMDSSCLLAGWQGREVDAANRAITSIKYSVGVLHPAYARAYAIFLTMA